MSCKTDVHRIRAIVLDVDGVMTDDRIGYRGDSEEEIKFFCVKDGTGVLLAHAAGLKVAVITGRPCAATEMRCRNLKIDAVMNGRGGKLHVLSEACAVMGVPPEECLYVGDDLIDVPVMRVCGLAATPADATPYAKAEADWVLERNGGFGAVREAVERLLREQGCLETAIEKGFQLYWGK